ncbi:MAG: HD domain-containing protein [Clostridia bacterium]|nr:HD domain-containing protein [Clostridia bacterium]
MDKSLHFDEFMALVEDLMASPAVQKMRWFRHHFNVNRLEHSVSVAYLSFLVVRRLGGNVRAAARGGLLHDLFLYDPRERGSYRGPHPLTHPQVALENARRHFVLSVLEEEIILTHMFPVGTAIPLHLESLTVCLVDKYCAVNECIGSFADSALAARVAEVMA